MTILKRLFSICSLLVLAACGGGGGDSGSPPFGGGTTPIGNTPTASDLVLVLSSNTIPNTGTGAVTLTVTALDERRVALPGVAVALSANSDGVITIPAATGTTTTDSRVTNAQGQIVATVGIGSNTTNRTITLTAASGSLTRTISLAVVNAPSGTVATSIELIAESTSVTTAGDGVVIRAFVKDANNNALTAAPLIFATSTGTLSAISSVTNAAGTGSATLSAGSDKSNRNAVVTVRSGTVVNTLTLPIDGTTVRVSGPTSLIQRTSGAFDVAVSDSRGNPVPGVVVTAVSSLGNPTVTSAPERRTDANGQVRFNYTATNAGTDSLEFTSSGARNPSTQLVVSSQTFAFVSPSASATVNVGTTQPLTVELQGVTPLAGVRIDFAATGGVLSGGSLAPASTQTNAAGQATVNFSSTSAGPVTVQATVVGTGSSTTLPLRVVATVPSTLVLQISETAIAPNTSAAGTNETLVLAKVSDAAGNPVQGQTVNFTRVTDPSGGNLLQVSAPTDDSGTATVRYRSGSQSTANNGVVLSATVAGTTPAVTGSATLTVSQSALFIALGTGNVITNLDPQTYKKDWVVYVTDSNGIPVNGATLTIKAIPVNYRTGVLGWNGAFWAYAAPIYSCRSEDRNQNGTLDRTPRDEDDNADGVLWPGNVISVTPGSVQTVNGRATISLIYAESYAPWVDLLLTASATVAGTESRTDAQFIVNGFADDFNKQDVPPAGVVSPFGDRPKPAALAVPGACSLLTVAPLIP